VIRRPPIAPSAALAAACAAACSGGGGLPLGGPFGGALDTSLVTDAGFPNDGDLPGDGDGVLPLSTVIGAGISGESGVAPTWTQLFTTYFESGTLGNCAHSGCHGNVMTSPSAAFAWLEGQAQVGSSPPPIADPNSSCLSWLGGDMPPDGLTTDPVAQLDLDRWAMAGANDN
jgi:hypothetical protein